MTTPQISVIIPVYNRLDALLMTISSLKSQSLPLDCFEVILVDDGSSESVEQVVLAQDWPFSIILLGNYHHGAASARNLGAAQAVGEVFLFLDSDMIATADLLTRHLENHKQEQGNIVLGRRDLYQESNVVSLMDRLWYGPGGSDPRLKRLPATFMEALTCNLSVRGGEWYRLGGFDETFVALGYEDVEFAYRATQQGVGIIFDPHALAYHYHPMSLRQRCIQVRNYTFAAVLLLRKHPELCGQIDYLQSKEPVHWKVDLPGLIIRKIGHEVLATTPALHGMENLFSWLERRNAPEALLRVLYWQILGSYAMHGFRQGLQELG